MLYFTIETKAINWRKCWMTLQHNCKILHSDKSSDFCIASWPPGCSFFWHGFAFLWIVVCSWFNGRLPVLDAVDAVIDEGVFVSNLSAFMKVIWTNKALVAADAGDNFATDAFCCCMRWKCISIQIDCIGIFTVLLLGERKIGAKISMCYFHSLSKMSVWIQIGIDQGEW